MLQVFPIHPPVHLQISGAMHVPPLWQAEQTAMIGKSLHTYMGNQLYITYYIYI